MKETLCQKEKERKAKGGEEDWQINKGVGEILVELKGIQCCGKSEKRCLYPAYTVCSHRCVRALW